MKHYSYFTFSNNILLMHYIIDFMHKWKNRFKVSNLNMGWKSLS